MSTTASSSALSEPAAGLKHRDRPYRARRIPVAVFASDEVSRSGIATQLRSHSELTVVDEDEAPSVAVVSVEHMDERVAQQIKVLLRAGCPHVVLIANELDSAGMLAAVEAGACALLRRPEVVPEHLARVVVAASNGYGNLPPDLLSSLLAQVGRLHNDVLAPRGLNVNGFSDREIAVLELVAEGYDTAEIARELCYSERTVKNILHGVTARFHLKSRCHAVAFAIRAGVI